MKTLWSHFVRTFHAVIVILCTILPLQSVVFKDPEHHNHYLMVAKSGSIVFVKDRARATEFVLENITPQGLVGATHYFVTYRKKYLHFNNGKFSLQPTNTSEGARWYRVIHYQYIDNLRNETNKIIVEEREKRAA